MKLFILCCLILLCLCGTSQHQLADSLQSLLRKHPAADTLRLNLLLELAKTAAVEEEGTVVLDEAIRLAKLIKAPLHLGNAWLLKAADLTTLGHDSAAIHIVLDSALPVFRNNKLTERVARAYGLLGRIYQQRSEYYKAIEYGQLSIKISQQSGDARAMSRVLNEVATSYKFLSDYPQSSKYYIQALQQLEPFDDPSSKAMIIANLASNERTLKKYSSALHYYRQALSMQLAAQDSAMAAKTLHGIGITYDYLLNADSSLWYFSRALEINQRHDYRLRMAENLNSIGLLQRAANQFTSAYQYFTRARALFNELNYERSVYETQVNIAALFSEAPDSFFTKHTIPRAERYIQAGAMFKEIVEYGKKTRQFDLESLGWEGLSQVYEQKSDFRAALAAYKQVLNLRDSSINEEKIDLTTRQLSALEFKTKEAALQAQHQGALQQQKTVKNAVASGAGILTLGSIISLIFYKRKRDALAVRDEAEFKAEVAHTEMKALRAQMNPHFIFNSLNSISDFITKNDLPSADRYLTRFAKLMRMILENSEQPEVSLADDLKALELYMQLESMRLNHKFSYQVSIDESLDAATTMVPPLLLQPFVENSIWHGIAHKEGSGHIMIRVKKESDEMISCVVEDDGIGRQQPFDRNVPPAEKTSLGMKITQSRIDIFNKLKHSRAIVELSDLAQGLRVELKLPLIHQF